MWSELRTIVGVGLVCCIVVLVISPFGDVPATTLRAKQAALMALTALVMCCTSALRMGVYGSTGALVSDVGSPGREMLQQSFVLLASDSPQHCPGDQSWATPKNILPNEEI